MSESQNTVQDSRLRKLVFAGVFAAITYVVFTYLAIRIPTPGAGQVSIHLGNAFVVLGALLLGSLYGGIGGAIGLTIADLIDPVYIAFNAIFDPLLRYFYKILILGKPAAEVSFAINFAVTLLNSVVSAVIVVVLYMALRAPLKKLGLFFRF